MFKDLFSNIRTIYRKVKLTESSLKQMVSAARQGSGSSPSEVYNVPPDVYDRLMAFKAKRGLPSVETAMLIILQEYFGLVQAPMLTGTDTTASRLKTLEAKFTSLSETLEEIRAAIATLQASSSPPLSESESPSERQSPLPLLDAQATAQSESNPTVDQSESPESELPLLEGSDSSAAPMMPEREPDEAQSGELAIAEPLNQQFTTPMTQAALARRLGVSTSSISRMQSKPNFSEWSQQKDPEGIAWVKSPDTKMFHPQTHK